MILMNLLFIETLHINACDITVSLRKYQAVKRYVTVRVVV
jgi:hypothetical protein